MDVVTLIDGYCTNEQEKALKMKEMMEAKGLIVPWSCYI